MVHRDVTRIFPVAFRWAQVIFVDCTSLQHATLKQHAGSHPDIIQKVWMENPNDIEVIIRFFFRYLRALAPQVLHGDVMVAAFCDGGRHRSLAVSCILQYCLWMDCFETIEGVWCLNSPHWSVDQCMSDHYCCEFCHFKPETRSEFYWSQIRQLYIRLRKELLGF